ncbi:hypothetical protein FKM82_010519 [Ascaphus truei]
MPFIGTTDISSTLSNLTVVLQVWQKCTNRRCCVQYCTAIVSSLGMESMWVCITVSIPKHDLTPVSPDLSRTGHYKNNREYLLLPPSGPIEGITLPTPPSFVTLLHGRKGQHVYALFFTYYVTLQYCLPMIPFF